MGSLMSGWDSPVRNSKSGKYERNWSSTKGEIEAYWRSKKKIEEEHLRAISGLSVDSSQGETFKEPVRRLQRSSSLPVQNTKEGFMDLETKTSFTKEGFKDMEAKTSLEELIKKNGWWTKSNWAFLNEPPVIASEGPSFKYASQFHVSKPDTLAGISA